jgi:hypothetical protein
MEWSDEFRNLKWLIVIIEEVYGVPVSFISYLRFRLVLLEWIHVDGAYGTSVALSSRINHS